VITEKEKRKKKKRREEERGSVEPKNCFGHNMSRKIRVIQNLKGMSIVTKPTKVLVRATSQLCFNFPENKKY
jgi:hypothetical protein